MKNLKRYQLVLDITETEESLRDSFEDWLIEEGFRNIPKGYWSVDTDSKDIADIVPTKFLDGKLKVQFFPIDHFNMKTR